MRAATAMPPPDAPLTGIPTGTLTGARRRRGRRRWQGWLIWGVAVLAVALLTAFGSEAVPWAFEVPRHRVVPVAAWIGAGMKWLVNDASLGPFTVREATRFAAGVLEAPYRLVLAALQSGWSAGPGGGSADGAALRLAPLPYSVVVAIGGGLGWWLGGVRTGLLVSGCFAVLAAFGQWQAAMVTLASILVAVPLGVAGGLALGIAAFRHRWLERGLRPVLDLMQTIPVFAYLVPVLILFGFGPVAAIVATLIYAMPPMTRITTLALQRVPPDLPELGAMVGCTPRQMTWRVMVPAARDALMVGVNQVIMLSLNMVIIASMIGAGGLGFDVLAALRRLDIGAGLESGLAIVALAVALDRLSQAAALRRRGADRGLRRPFWPVVVLVAAVAALAQAVPALRILPEVAYLSTGTVFDRLVGWINVTYFDALEWVRDAALLNVLVPVRRFLLMLPWPGVVALLALAGWRLSGPRLAGLVAVLATSIALTGQWPAAMVTVYLCGLSVVLAMLIGVPLGIAAAGRERLWAALRLVIDTAQVLPSFVWLMPAVMLFRVGDFTALVAVVAFAVVPAIRYTVLGLQGVDPRLIEAGRAMGATPWQILTRIRLRLALPEILLGLNQTVMFALSMLVITALVGTRDLGQEVYVALAKADPGRGVVAGLAVAFIAIIADRLIGAAAARARARLGLGPAADAGQAAP